MELEYKCDLFLVKYIIEHNIDMKKTLDEANQRIKKYQDEIQKINKENDEIIKIRKNIAGKKEEYTSDFLD